MSAPAIMPFYVAEYLADTGHLTRDEHGAYMLLIMHYWQNGGLPDDARKLAKITRSESVDDWSSIASTISALFQPGWRHKRIDAELAKAKNKHEKRANAGKIGGLTRASNASFLLEQKSSNASRAPSPAPITLTSLSYDSVLEQEPSKLASTRDQPKAAKKRVTHLPAGYAELSRVLDDERTKAVIEHRQKFKKPLTAHAAKLLAQKFEQCPNPNEAADEMVARGWQGFKPEWLEARQANAKPVPKAQPPPHQYDPNIPPEQLEEMLADIEREYGGRRIR